MTAKEAIEYLNDPIGKDLMQHNEAVAMASDALESVDKYRWHDLRKDPNDLPKNDLDLCLIERQVNGFHRFEIISEWSLKYSASHHNIIAWRYIEPFEEAERKNG